MEQLTGTHRYQLDDKGRIPLPARFREALADGGMFTVGHERCLWVFPMEEYRARAERFRALPISDRGARNFNRVFFGTSEELSMDKHGRMPVPSGLRSLLSIGQQVVVVGDGDHLEIWDLQEYDRLFGRLLEEYLDGSLVPEGRQA